MVTAWISASAAAASASLVETPLDVRDLLATADGVEVCELIAHGWHGDLAGAPTIAGWVHRRSVGEGSLARVVAAGASGALRLQVDADAGAVWLARHRRGVLVHALMATRWADRAPALPGVATMAARLGMRAVPRGRTTAWRALWAVRADAEWLVRGARARGARADDRALMAQCAHYVFAFGDGDARMSPERALGYLAAGIGAPEAWDIEAGPASTRPSSATLDVLAALRGA